MKEIFRNKVIWITGASSGIGEAFARELIHYNNHLILTARRIDNLNSIKNDLVQKGYSADHIHLLPADLSEIKSLPDLTQQAIAIKGKIDILFNNAGVSQRGYMMDTPFVVEQQLLQINLISPIALAKSILPHFLSRKSGRLIVTSSLMGELELAASTTYSAAKHALNGYFGSLFYELRPLNIHVQILQPGFVKTEISLKAINSKGVQHQKMDSTHAQAMSPEIFVKKAFKKLNKNNLYINIAGPEIFALYLKRWIPCWYQKLVLKRADKVLKDRLARIFQD